MQMEEVLDKLQKIFKKTNIKLLQKNKRTILYESREFRKFPRHRVFGQYKEFTSKELTKKKKITSISNRSTKENLERDENLMEIQKNENKIN